MSPRGGMRPGSGRKRTMEGGQLLTVYVSRPNLEELDRRRGAVSRSAYVRELLRPEAVAVLEPAADSTPPPVQP